jgi:hypothetical protein
MRSAVYIGKMSSCRFSSRPSLPRTVKIVGRPAKRFPAGAAFGGGGGTDATWRGRTLSGKLT